MGEIPEKDDRDKIIIYQLNDELAEFEELEIDENEVKLYEILDPSFILLFLDPGNYKAFIWQGSEASTRMKFISAKLASSVRDRHGAAMKIMTADDGNEPMGFKVMVGLEEEIDYEEEQTGPTYTGTAEDMELLSLASRDKIILLLEKVGLPEGYKRSMVIVKNKLYKYHVQEEEYMGKMIEGKQLLPLDEKENVPDGPYLAENYVPRLLFSYNNVIFTELLEKMTPEEIAKQKAEEELALKQMVAEKAEQAE